MAVPKRKKSRSNTRTRRARWLETSQVPLVEKIENGRVTYSLPHRAREVTDSTGQALFLEYKGRKVTDA